MNYWCQMQQLLLITMMHKYVLSVHDNQYESIQAPIAANVPRHLPVKVDLPAPLKIVVVDGVQLRAEVG